MQNFNLGMFLSILWMDLSVQRLSINTRTKLVNYVPEHSP